MRIEDKDKIVAGYKNYLNNRVSAIGALLKDGNLPEGVSAELATELMNGMKGALNEITTMEESDQVYNVFYAGSKGEGGVSFDSNTDQVNIGIGKGELATSFVSDVGIISHEMKHGYQYETNEISFDGTGSAALYDIGDETAAYNRELVVSSSLWEYKGTTRTDSWTREFGAKMTPAAYQGLSSGPININSKEGLMMRVRNIANGSLGRKPYNYYKGWQKDYQSGTKEK